MAMRFFLRSFFAAIVAAVSIRSTAAFQSLANSNGSSAASTGAGTTDSSLDAVSRREALTVAGTATSMVVASVGAPLEALAETKKKPKPIYSFNGIYKDPNHPKGYRMLAGAVGKKGILTMQDEPEVGKVDDLSFQSEVIQSGYDAGKIALTIDFTSKGGSKIVATVDKDSSIRFPDGDVWKKQTGGVEGIYIDGFAPYPKYRRIIRDLTPVQGSDQNLVVELISGKTTFLCYGHKDSKTAVTIDFPGAKTCTGAVSLKNGVITFADGNTWTKV